MYIVNYDCPYNRDSQRQQGPVSQTTRPMGKCIAGIFFETGPESLPHHSLLLFSAQTIFQGYG